MEMGLSMKNVGESIKGYLLNVAEDDTGEFVFTNTLGTIRDLVGTSFICISDIKLDDRSFKLFYSDSSNGKVSGVSVGGKVLAHGNLLIAGMNSHKDPIRSLTDKELDIIKSNIGMMDVGEGANKYNTYCLCNMAFI